MIILNSIGYIVGHSGSKNWRINNMCTVKLNKLIYDCLPLRLNQKFLKFFSSTCQPFWCCSVRKKFQKWGKPCGFPKLNFWQISAYCMQPWTRTHYSDDAKTIHKAEQNCPLWLIKGIHQELWGCLKSPYFNFQASQVGFNFSFMYTY